MSLSRVYLYLGVVVLMVGAGFGLDYYLRPIPQDAARIIRPPNFQSVIDRTGQDARSSIGGAFSLVDHDGNPVTDADFRGRHTLIFFGYTYCPDVCPTNLGTMTAALELLGDDARKVQPLFITVDPDRDTPEQMKMYVDHFHKSLIGLTGSKQQIKAVAKAYGVYSKKSDEDPDDPENYLNDHTATTFLMSPDGKFETFFRNGATAESVARKIRSFF